MDTLTPHQRLRAMRGNKSFGTKPEVRVYGMLRALGLSPQEHAKLPGKPDLFLNGSRVAVFVEGCFWHGCPRHYRRPKTNTRFWDNKVQTNMRRDARNRRRLRRMGVGIVRIWECRTKGGLLEESCATVAELALSGGPA